MSLAARGLGHRYGSIEALRDVSVTATPGRITAVIGPNAAGKSTLLRCLIGALRPSSGEALIDGEIAHRMSTKRLAQRVAYVSQRPVVAAAFTVRQVVELGRYALPASRARTEAAIAELDLTDIADRPFPALSVGQQQRATLARAMAQLADDGHLVLDEPTSAMDLRHAADSMAVLRRAADGGVSVVMALHDLTTAGLVADDCWLLAGGRLVAAGPTGEALDIGRLRDVFGLEFEWIKRPDGPPILVGAGTEAGP